MRIAAIIALMPVLACSNGDVLSDGHSGKDSGSKEAGLGQSGSKEGSASDFEFSTSIPPTNVTSINLTFSCSWDRIAATDIDSLQVICTAGGLAAADTKYDWVVPGAKILPGDAPEKIRIETTRALLPLANVTVTASSESRGEAPSSYSGSLAKHLPGFAGSSGLAACFIDGQKPVQDCLNAAGLYVQADSSITTEPVGGGCKLTAEPALIRKSRADVVTLSLSATDGASVDDYLFVESDFSNGNVVSRQATSVQFQPLTADVMLEDRLRFAAVAANGKVCFAEVRVTFVEVAVAAHSEISAATSAAEPGRSRTTFQVSFLSPDEVVTDAALLAFSKDFSEPRFAYAAPVCVGRICSQVVSLDYARKFVATTTRYTGQIVELRVNATTTAPFAVRFDRAFNVVVGGEKVPARTIDGSAESL